MLLRHLRMETSKSNETMRRKIIKRSRMDVRAALKALRRASKKLFCFCWRTGTEKDNEVTVDCKTRCSSHPCVSSLIDASCKDGSIASVYCTCFCFFSNDDCMEDKKAFLDEYVLSLRECLQIRDAEAFVKLGYTCVTHQKNEPPTNLDVQNVTTLLEKQTQTEECCVNRNTSRCERLEGTKKASDDVGPKSDSPMCIMMFQPSSLALMTSPSQEIERDQCTVILQPSSTRITCPRVKGWGSKALISHFRSRKCKKSVEVSKIKNDFFLENQRAILENLHNEMIEKCKTEWNTTINCK